MVKRFSDLSDEGSIPLNAPNVTHFEIQKVAQLHKGCRAKRKLLQQSQLEAHHVKPRGDLALFTLISDSNLQEHLTRTLFGLLEPV